MKASLFDSLQGEEFPYNTLQYLSLLTVFTTIFSQGTIISYTTAHNVLHMT